MNHPLDPVALANIKSSAICVHLVLTWGEAGFGKSIKKIICENEDDPGGTYVIYMNPQPLD